MSFSNQVKQEILENKIENECCKRAFLTGIIKTISELSLQQGKLFLEFKTDNLKLCEKINELLNNKYSCVGEIEEDEDIVFKRKNRYILKLNETLTKKVLYDCDVISNLDEVRLDQDLNYSVENECCKRAFIIGIFLGCATTNIVLKSINPDLKHSGGYHLEFVLSNQKTAEELVNLLDEIEIYAKITIRKNQYIVYIKEAEQVSDMLAYVGANQAVLQLQNEIAVRQVRNNVNRQNNCLSGNITKTIDASMRQIECIELIQEKIGIENLDDDLAELCCLRLANPDEPLVNLIKLYSKPISKSGINYRFSKIEKIALNLLDF